MGLDVNYLTARIENSRLTTFGSGRFKLTLTADAALTTNDLPPELHTIGNKVGYLSGQVVASTGGTDPLLLTFPDGEVPTRLSLISCVVDNSGVKSTVPLQIYSDGISALGTVLANAIYYLDGIVYLYD